VSFVVSGLGLFCQIPRANNQELLFLFRYVKDQSTRHTSALRPNIVLYHLFALMSRKKGLFLVEERPFVVVKKIRKVLLLAPQSLP
jgi:hypothetical protein